jgi:hypothetical protein
VRSVRLALLGTAVLLAAGCGGSSGGKSSGEENKSAGQIVTDAETAAKSATAVHVVGSGVSGGSPLVLDLYLVAGKGGKGRLTVNGLTFDIVRVGQTAYFRGDSSFWRHFGNDALAALLKGRWLSEPVSHGALATFAPLTDIGKLFHAILSTHGKLSKGQTTTVKGQAAVAIIDRSSSGGTLYVAISGPPFPLEVDAPSGKQGKIDFEEWNQPVKLVAPANAVDVSKLKGFSG